MYGDEFAVFINFNAIDDTIAIISINLDGADVADERIGDAGGLNQLQAQSLRIKIIRRLALE